MYDIFFKKLIRKMIKHNSKNQRQQQFKNGESRLLAGTSFKLLGLF
jgi:hypothetical protein